jgi:hypothetical protein
LSIDKYLVSITVNGRSYETDTLAESLFSGASKLDRSIELEYNFDVFNTLDLLEQLYRNFVIKMRGSIHDPARQTARRHHQRRWPTGIQSPMAS